MAEPGALLAPTSGTNAASACSSPSIAISGAISLAIFKASTTLSTTSCFAEPFVEKLNSATFGSIPATAWAVRAVQTAICASWEASGTGVTATSPITRIPFLPYSGACVSNNIAPETQVMPGAVLIICKAGRSTSPVVLRAPANWPSASPFLIIRQPR